MRTARKLFGISILSLLAFSNVYRWLFPRDGRPEDGQRVIEVSAAGRGSRRAPDVRLACRDLGRRDADAPVLILIHGTPMAGETFGRLTPELAESFRVLIPDLPGFGGSSLRIPDYSIKAHARYVLRLMRALDIERAHVLGYSQGGGVALQVWNEEPDRVESLILLSSIGVQELELLGDYRMNHVLYGLQLWAIRFALAVIPHFGWLDDAYLNVPYARNYSDSDQRPLRGILRRIDKPMLILHGLEDSLVPPAAADEHARIVPQSRLRKFPGGHGLVFHDTRLLADAIAEFVGEVERGEGVTRDTANMARAAAAEEPFTWKRVPPAQGFSLWIVALCISLATFVSEDLACIGGGILAAHGTVSYAVITLACFVGITVGDGLLYLAGKHLGRPALRRAPLRWMVDEDDVARARAWFAEKGPAVIVLSRFTPGTRLATYVAAGVLGTPFLRFMVYLALAAAVWTPLLVGVSYLLGAEAFRLLDAYERYSLLAVLLVVLAVLLLLRLVAPLSTYRGRRLLLSRWRRRTRWEFWPPWVFYPPLLIYIFWLGLRHRCPTLFTAANPAMPAGGLVGESKFDIMRGLGREPEIARTAMIAVRDTPDERSRNLRRFLQEHHLDYPVVLKPDVGERGEGIQILRSEPEAVAACAAIRADHLLQEYVPGPEYGVFYYRLPDEKRGHILTITDKRFPAVIGDGKSTLEKLILADDRAVCMARFYLNLHAEQLYRVPAAGERVPLVQIGTHCRGAMFLDGTSLRTPALEEAIDRISRRYQGFYFGRYDVRVPSVEDFQAGLRLKVLEVNGVTSEATSIYDPSHSLLDAYRTLARQWALAFAIGAQNRRRGIEPLAAWEFLRLLKREWLDR